MTDDYVTLWYADGVARMTLTRPGTHNGIDPGMVAGLEAAVDKLPAAARVLLITAEGPNFSVGGDLAYFTDATCCGTFSDAVEPMIRPFHETLARLSELSIPVVCAVHGATAGGALGLCWVSDVVIAADDLKLATGFSALGLSGDGGSSWHLPRLVGMRRAQELLITGRVLSAAEALDWGLITRVVSPGELQDVAAETATRLAGGSLSGHTAMKRLLRHSGSITLREHYAAELSEMVSTGATPDVAEGILAFSERRRPQFPSAN
jgi:enoyl-CoA hydratase/carnithine racemase